jgi:hypothetical protein
MKNERMFEAVAWPVVLSVSTVLGSLAAACMMPFVALAVVVAGSMPSKRGVATVTAIVAANQAIGFSLLSFPFDLPTAAWGIALLCGTLAAFGVARGILGDSSDFIAARLAFAGASAFAAYELLLFAFAHVAGGIETFTPEIVWLIGRNETIWLVALVTLRLIATGFAPHVFGARPRLRLV